MLELKLFIQPYTLYVYTHFPFILASIYWTTADQKKKQAVIIVTMVAVLLSDPPPASCLDAWTLTQKLWARQLIFFFILRFERWKQKVWVATATRNDKLVVAQRSRLSG